MSADACSCAPKAGRATASGVVVWRVGAAGAGACGFMRSRPAGSVVSAVASAGRPASAMRAGDRCGAAVAAAFGSTTAVAASAVTATVACAVAAAIAAGTCPAKAGSGAASAAGGLGRRERRSELQGEATARSGAAGFSSGVTVSSVATSVGMVASVAGGLSTWSAVGRGAASRRAGPRSARREAPWSGRAGRSSRRLPSSRRVGASVLFGVAAPSSVANASADGACVRLVTTDGRSASAAPRVGAAVRSVVMCL